MNLLISKNIYFKTDLKDEILKNFIFSEMPSDYLKFLRKSNNISNFPQLNALIGSPQDSNWHPEGDVWNHTLLVVDAACDYRKQLNDEFKAITLMLGALCHDFGKPYTLIFEDGRFRNPAHDIKGVFPTQIFLNQCKFSPDIIEQVSKLVKEHLRPMQLYKLKDSIKLSTISKLAKRINIDELILVSKSDHKGRITSDNSNTEFPHCDWLESKVKEINFTKEHLTPLITGNDLIKLKFKPGKIFKNILNHISELQMQGVINSKEAALAIAKQYFK